MADWYIDKAASGGGDGTSWGAAWNNFASFNAAVGSGDTIWIRSGDYTGELFFIDAKSELTIKHDPDTDGNVVLSALSVWNSSGILIDVLGADGSQRFLIVGATNNTDTTDAARTALSRQVWVRKTTDCVLRGLKTSRESVFADDTAQVHGIQIDNECDFVTVEDCDIRYTSGDGINSFPGNGATDGLFTHGIYRRNTIYAVADDGIQTGYGGFTITDNYIDNAGQAVMLNAHPDGIQVNPIGASQKNNPTGARNFRIARNTIARFNQNIFLEYVDSNIFVENNVIIGWRPTDEVASALGGYSNSGIVASVITANDGGDLVIANNTFYNFLVSPAINGSWADTDPSNTKNNLFLNCRFWVLNSAEADFSLDSTNRCWDTDGVVFYESSAGAVVAASTDSARGLGSAIKADPLTVDHADEDLRLQATSPLIDAGADMSAYFDADRLGVERPNGNGWDIGAYEYDAGGESPEEGQPAYVRPRRTRSRLLTP